MRLSGVAGDGEHSGTPMADEAVPDGQILNGNRGADAGATVANSSVEREPIEVDRRGPSIHRDPVTDSCVGQVLRQVVGAPRRDRERNRRDRCPRLDLVERLHGRRYRTRRSQAAGHDQATRNRNYHRDVKNELPDETHWKVMHRKAPSQSVERSGLNSNKKGSTRDLSGSAMDSGGDGGFRLPTRKTRNRLCESCS